MSHPTQQEFVYRGKMVTLRLDITEKPDGSVRRIEVVEHAPAVAIVATDNAANLILVRQERPAIGEVLLELPAGLMEQDETTEDAARRELEEETGYRAGALEKLPGFYTSAGFTTEYIHVLHAPDAQAGEPHPDIDEVIEVVLTTREEALAHISSGRIQDAKSIAGILSWVHLLPSPGR